MSSELPPTEYFSGIDFNPSFYQSSSSDSLTATTGKKLFLSYPVAQGSETFPSNITLLSTLTDSSGDVGTLGQYLSSTTSGVSWTTPSSGSTYVAYSASATLPTITDPTLLVVVSGATVGKVITIPATGYSVGQKIQIKNTGSVVASISTSLITAFLYSSTSAAISITLESGDVVNLIYTGFAWIQ